MSALLPFPVARARDAAVVRQHVRLRGEAEGHAQTVIRVATQRAIDALLRDATSCAWAIHVGCCALRGRPVPRLRAVAP